MVPFSSVLFLNVNVGRLLLVSALSTGDTSIGVVGLTLFVVTVAVLEAALVPSSLYATIFLV